MSFLKNWIISVCRVRTVIYIYWRWDVFVVVYVLLFIEWLHVVILGRMYILYSLRSSLMNNGFSEKALFDSALTLAKYLIIAFHLLIFERLNDSLCALSQVYNLLVKNYPRFLDLISGFLILIFLVHWTPFHQIALFYTIFVLKFICLGVDSLFIWSFGIMFCLNLCIPWLIVNEIPPVDFPINITILLAKIVLHNHIILIVRHVFAWLQNLLFFLHWGIVSFVLIVLYLLDFFQVLFAWRVAFMRFRQRHSKVLLIREVSVWNWANLFILCWTRLIVTLHQVFGCFILGLIPNPS